jgi:hypothetical protein
VARRDAGADEVSLSTRKCTDEEDEYAMRRVRIAFIATLLAAGVVAVTGAGAGAAASVATEPSDGAICGAWEPRGGAGDGFRRLCIDGNLYWYEYR